MSAQRAAQIAQILAQRKPLAQKVQNVSRHLEAVTAALQQLETSRQHLASVVKDRATQNRLQDIHLVPLLEQIAAERGTLQQLTARLERHTLNLGVIGRAGQGKSRLLQSLSGLSTAEIPTGDRSHCTGVRSTICHDPHAETYGEVWFHSEASFLAEVLHPYYEKLQLGSPPRTLTEFAQRLLPELPPSLIGLAEAGAMYEHLRRYHIHLEQYRQWLGHPSPHRIAKDQIREYVAQDTPDGQRLYFAYLAVRKARIVCCFPNASIGQIALIDMPGLGDTGLGDTERLIRILEQDVDLVLLVRMPRPPRDFWADVDVQLYDTARSALAHLPIALWSFLVLNRTDARSPLGDNGVYCQELQQTYCTSHLEVADCLVVNCADPEAVNQGVLEPVLDYLTQNMAQLDRRYATTCQEQLHRLHQATTQELTKARVALAAAPLSTHRFPELIRLFQQLWQDLTEGLEDFLKELRQQRDEPSYNFREQVQAMVQACREDTGVPSLAAIEARRKREGSYDIAYNQYLHEIRAYLSQHFLALDSSLQQSLEEVRAQVTQILAERGRLRPLSAAAGIQFLTEIAALIPDNLSRLKLGFQILANFALSYRGLIQHRIRTHLDRLTPDETPLKLPSSPTAEMVQKALQTLRAEALYECEQALDTFLCEPGQAIYAIVEEFVDRVLRAEGVKEEWQIFTERHSAEIWTTELAELTQHAKQQQEWQNVVQQALAVNRAELWEFT
ncbi:MAG: hypothetical protein ACUVSQ_08035 [Pseudanabaenaceae cyanobacterium]